MTSMFRKIFTQHRPLALSSILFALLLIFTTIKGVEATQAENKQLVLLIPEKTSLTEPVTQAWLDALKEEGIAVTLMTDHEFIKAVANKVPVAGVMLPDSVHTKASDLLITSLHDYVEAGGNLMITFDGAVLDLHTSAYAINHSRLSDLTGVRYAMLKSLRDQTTANGPIYFSTEGERELGIQPGKIDYLRSAKKPLGVLTTYAYKELVYSYYRTQSDGTAKVYAKSADGDHIVTVNQFGKGTVLFANLALGYLKTRSDGYLLHRFLLYFSNQIAKQPLLLTVPDAIGGIVLNLHVDSNASHSTLLELEQEDWFKQGPYSIHVTAGPDNNIDGDKLGLNIPQNMEMQGFLRRQARQGHDIGNHGGWAHNDYGHHVSESNAARYLPYLKLNNDTISGVIGKPAVSYSAPMGNQPIWSTQWLAEQGFKAYYTTADNGMGPTRSYTNGKPSAYPQLWAFPVSSLHTIATMDDLPGSGYEENEMALFVRGLFSYASTQHVARLFYFHPTALQDKKRVLYPMMQHAKQLASTGTFRFYSMPALADFRNHRETVDWKTDFDANTAKHLLVASSPGGLKSMSWSIPKTNASAVPPKILSGTASIRDDHASWIVVTGECDVLKIQWW